MKKFMFSFAVVALLVGAMTVAPQLTAQTTPAPTAQQDQPAVGAADQTAAKSFTGTIVKDGDKFVLQASSMTYQLDDQGKAKKYVGKTVEVMGSLDSTGNTIHVSDIKAGS